MRAGVVSRWSLVVVVGRRLSVVGRGSCHHRIHGGVAHRRARSLWIANGQGL